MKKRIVFLLAFFASLQLSSQAYMTAGGLRVGTDWGITLQQRVAKATTIEGILQSSLEREEVIVTGLVEQHYPIIFRGLNLYFGGGVHKGWLAEPSATDAPAAEPLEDPFGVTFIGGAELALGRLVISYDFKPAFNLSGGEKNFYSQTGVSVRYALLKNKVYKDLTKQRKKNKRKKDGNDDWKIWKKKD